MYHHHDPSPSFNAPPLSTYTTTPPRTHHDPYARDMRSTHQMPNVPPGSMFWTANNTRAPIRSQSTVTKKNSEKNRRDITVSCVAAIEIMTRDIHAGVAAGCPVCIEGSTELMPAFDGLYSGDKSKDADGLLTRMKRPKNDKLEASCMSQYLYVLHHHPKVYPQRVEELGELMEEQKNVQEWGSMEAGNSEAKLRAAW